MRGRSVVHGKSAEDVRRLLAPPASDLGPSMRPNTQPASLTLMPGPLAEVSGVVVVHSEEASSSIWALHTTVLPLAYSGAANVGPPHDPRIGLRLRTRPSSAPAAPCSSPRLS